MRDDSLAPEAPRGSFAGSVNIVMLSYVIDGALSFAAGVIVARALGPDGRGAFGLFVVSAALGQMLLGIGFGNAAIYYIGKGAMTVRDVVSAAHVVTLAAIAITAAAVALIVPWTGGTIIGGDVSAWLLVAAIPALIYAGALRIVLQAESRFWEMGIATAIQPLLMLACVLGLYAAGTDTAESVVVAWIFSNACAAAFCLLRIGLREVDVRQIARPRFDVLTSLAHFGAQGEAGNILQLLNYRLDQYVVRIFVGLAGVGIYAVGVSMTEGVWMIANAVAIVLLPRLTAASDEDVRWMTPLATRNTVAIAAGVAVVLGVAAPLIIPPFFGHDYDESVQALWWLLPGTVALTGSKVLTSYIFSRGRPLVNTGITVVSLVVTTVTLFALVPAFGVNGAALASSLAYCAHFAAALYAYRRLSGEPLRDVLIPERGDVRLYVEAWRGLVSRGGRRATLDAGAPRPGV